MSRLKIIWLFLFLTIPASSTYILVVTLKDKKKPIIQLPFPSQTKPTHPCTLKIAKRTSIHIYPQPTLLKFKLLNDPLLVKNHDRRNSEDFNAKEGVSIQCTFMLVSGVYMCVCVCEFNVPKGMFGMLWRYEKGDRMQHHAVVVVVFFFFGIHYLVSEHHRHWLIQIWAG